MEDIEEQVEEKSNDLLKDIAYFVVDKTAIIYLNSALDLIVNEALSREDAQKAMLNAINKSLTPVPHEKEKTLSEDKK